MGLDFLAFLATIALELTDLVAPPARRLGQPRADDPRRTVARGAARGARSAEAAARPGHRPRATAHAAPPSRRSAILAAGGSAVSKRCGTRAGPEVQRVTRERDIASRCSTTRVKCSWWRVTARPTRGFLRLCSSEHGFRISRPPDLHVDRTACPSSPVHGGDPLHDHPVDGGSSRSSAWRSTSSPRSTSPSSSSSGTTRDCPPRTWSAASSSSASAACRPRCPASRTSSRR